MTATRRTPEQLLIADADNATGNVPGLGFYDNELLDAHYIAGDGRVNENIGLTAVHPVFHSEHNRLVEHTKDVALATNDLAFLTEWLMPGTAPATFPVTPAEIAALQWNGERLFQAAKFGTEMQYQHLVFEEFARMVQPQIDIFVGPTQVYDIDINPAIVAEFAHTVYRFGHSMLTETVDRLDPNFASSEIGLIAAFLNPLEFAASGPTPEEAAGAIVRGVTRQAGNEIDEFVTEALRNNLLGLPLDLAAINIARGRDTGIPSLNAARREFFDQTGDTPAAALFELGRFRAAPEAPGIAGQLHRRLRHARDDPRRARPSKTSARPPWTLVFGGARRARRPARLPQQHRRMGERRERRSRSPASTMSICGSAAWPNRKCRSAACSARRSTSSSRPSWRICRTATGSIIWIAPRGSTSSPSWRTTRSPR